ncbi:MAG: tRNA (adenosine(37)-N6)-dimethylallyltransferase MiaA [Sandaracinaceae bacterium]
MSVGPDRRPPLLVVGGVTGAGKTASGLTLARRLGGELIGADSVQVVRGFDIGSAKPTAAELGPTPHHLIDVVDPDEAIDAARYARLADRAIREVRARGRLPIVVGGTGLWLRALLRGLVDLPPPDPAIRARLEGEAARGGDARLHARLAREDPEAARRIHPRDRLRIVRALEVREQTGEPLGELWARHARGGPRYDHLLVVLDRPRPELYAGLRARIAAMLAAGWVEEVRGLLARWGPSVRAMGSVGYRQVADHVRRGVPLDETERLAYRATRTYSRRQRTWFRGEEGPSWSTDAATLRSADGMARIEAWWTERSGSTSGEEA